MCSIVLSNIMVKKTIFACFSFSFKTTLFLLLFLCLFHFASPFIRREWGTYQESVPFRIFQQPLSFEASIALDVPVFKKDVHIFFFFQKKRKYERFLLQKKRET